MPNGDDEDGEWLIASKLKVGDKVLRPDGLWTRITSIEQSTEPTIVYNLEVEGNHNYFVSEIGVLSHNCNITVLGNTPAYKTLARQLKATYLNIPKRMSSKMTPDEIWKINEGFLDAVVKRGDTIILETPFNKIRKGTFFDREVKYLMDRGYVVSEDGRRLLRGTQ